MANHDDEQAFSDEEEFLDQFLEETTSLRLSAESSLDALSQLSRQFPRDCSIGDRLGILRESLEQLAHTLTGKLELINSFVRDGTDVIDGRLALTTRVLSERSDEIAVSLAQLSNELSMLGEKLETPPAPVPVAVPDDSTTVESIARAEKALGELLRAIDASNLNVARSYSEIETRLDRLETALGRIADRSKSSFGWLKVLAAVIVPLLLAGAIAYFCSRHGTNPLR